MKVVLEFPQYLGQLPMLSCTKMFLDFLCYFLWICVLHIAVRYYAMFTLSGCLSHFAQVPSEFPIGDCCTIHFDLLRKCFPFEVLLVKLIMM